VAELQRLQEAIGSHVLRFEHMGSTSVPGLDSKPIIDISAAVDDLGIVPSLFQVLKTLGYGPIAQESANRYDLWKLCDKGRPSHILHFMADGSDAWKRPLVFRDALREDSDLRDDYSSLKKNLASACGNDIKRYGNGKTEFVERVVNNRLNRH
jgi:GrpB-like predicted nucleotidyltransferase (UPF0157 family)